jgi:ElaB/YqjD/DUF883 family membrane-anchored ribosome-binding protein
MISFRLPLSVVVSLALVGVSACGGDDDSGSGDADSGVIASVEESAGSVEQELHDDAVAALDEAKQLWSGLEGEVSDATRSAYDAAGTELDRIEGNLSSAADQTGDTAVRAYREVEHDLEGLANRTDSLLHDVGHELADGERAAWHETQAAYRATANFASHAIGSLF